MKKQKGFTLIDVMIVVAILGILAAIAISAPKAHNGFICQGGYEFTYQGQQIIGQNGGGVPCPVSQQ